MVISVSRRCDIPRFAFGWFLEKLDSLFVDVTNPFNPRQERRVPLLPPGPGRPADESAELFAFWTRDPKEILIFSDELERRGYAFYVMVTLNSYPALLEPNLPPAEEVIHTMRGLAAKISAERVIWRYDPIFLSNITDFEFHRRNFADLAARLGGAAGRVIVSVYDGYRGAEKRIKKLEEGGSLERLPAGEGLRQLLREIAGTAASGGMEIQSCAEEGLSECGIKAGACIDGAYIERVFGVKVPGRERGRPGCLCSKSADIGSYGRCPAGCVYCYGSRG